MTAISYLCTEGWGMPWYSFVGLCVGCLQKSYLGLREHSTAAEKGWARRTHMQLPSEVGLICISATTQKHHSLETHQKQQVDILTVHPSDRSCHFSGRKHFGIINCITGVVCHEPQMGEPTCRFESRQHWTMFSIKLEVNSGRLNTLKCTALWLLFTSWMLDSTYNSG